jgi:hypothetical protein
LLGGARSLLGDVGGVGAVVDVLVSGPRLSSSQSGSTGGVDGVGPGTRLERSLAVSTSPPSQRPRPRSQMAPSMTCSVTSTSRPVGPRRSRRDRDRAVAERAGGARRPARPRGSRTRRRRSRARETCSRRSGEPAAAARCSARARSPALSGRGASSGRMRQSVSEFVRSHVASSLRRRHREAVARSDPRAAAPARRDVCGRARDANPRSRSPMNRTSAKSPSDARCSG